MCPTAMAATNPPPTTAVDACTLVTATEFSGLIADAPVTLESQQTPTGSKCSGVGNPVIPELDWLPNSSVSAATATYDKVVKDFVNDQEYPVHILRAPLGAGYTGLHLRSALFNGGHELLHDLVVAQHGTDVITLQFYFPPVFPAGDLVAQAKISIGRLPGQTAPTTTSTVTSTSSPTTTPTSTSASPTTTASPTSTSVSGPPVITDGTPGTTDTSWTLLGGLSVVLLSLGAILTATLRRQPQR